ncbi:MAG: hypothetical protein P8Q36_16345, partial [Alphaproteobacteria bacterium]|nr:hypothetical protein [Alphaproteobacteria bacterium]
MIIEQDGLAFRVGDRIAMSERPVRQVVGHGLIIRALWTGFALLWLTLTLGLALDMLASGENWGLLMPLVFAAVGVALLLFCIRAAFW